MNINNIIGLVVVATSLTAIPVKQSIAGKSPFIGKIMWVGYTFCTPGWTEANSQLLDIAPNSALLCSALLSLYGTTYGGDGETRFALLDLRGRESIHEISRPGLCLKAREKNTLTVTELPSHNHAINISGGSTGKNAAGSILGSPNQKIYDAPITASTTLDHSAVSNAGSNSAHENHPTFLVLCACKAVAGFYSSFPD